MTQVSRPSGASLLTGLFWPLLDHLAALIEAIYLDTAHLDPVARTSNAEELSLVGTTGCVASLPPCPPSATWSSTV